MIKQENNLIAEFLEWDIWELDDNQNCYKIPGNFLPNDTICQEMEALYPNEMRFHESWDWIFIVLEKIKCRGCIINIDLCFDLTCRICKIGKKDEKVINFYSEYDGITGVYDCVIQFIKWYNDYKKRNEKPS